MAQCTENYVFMAYTGVPWEGYWGTGKTKLVAMRGLHRAGGSHLVEKLGYIIYRVHPDTELDDGGNFVYPVGHPPIRVDDRRRQAP